MVWKRYKKVWYKKDENGWSTYNKTLTAKTEKELKAAISELPPSITNSNDHEEMFYFGELRCSKNIDLDYYDSRVY